MAKGRFFFGFILGAAAAVAAKYVYENKEEVQELLKEKSQVAFEEAIDFVDFASDKINTISEEVGKKAADYADYAKGQLEEIKETLNENINAVSADISEDPTE